MTICFYKDTIKEFIKVALKTRHSNNYELNWAPKLLRSHTKPHFSFLDTTLQPVETLLYLLPCFPYINLCFLWGFTRNNLVTPVSFALAIRIPSILYLPANFRCICYNINFRCPKHTHFNMLLQLLRLQAQVKKSAYLILVWLLSWSNQNKILLPKALLHCSLPEVNQILPYPSTRKLRFNDFLRRR